jgi:FkbM family methyltransferase
MKKQNLFEPQSLVFEQLIQNLKLNDIKNVECYKNCLDSISNKSVSLNFVDYSSSWVNIGDTSVGAGGEECTTIAIDDMNLTDVGFMKIDVQGYELNVLKGAERTITEHNPIVFIELEEHQLVKFNLKINDVYEYLKYIGYKIYKINLESYKNDHLCVKNKEELQNLIEVLPLLEI